jgi:hypothetical protein
LFYALVVFVIGFAAGATRVPLVAPRPGALAAVIPTFPVSGEVIIDSDDRQ